jgi:hypothetical protein
MLLSGSSEQVRVDAAYWHVHIKPWASAVVGSTQTNTLRHLYEGVSKSFRTGRLDRELEMVQLSPTRCSCIAIL